MFSFNKENSCSRSKSKQKLEVTIFEERKKSVTKCDKSQCSMRTSSPTQSIKQKFAERCSVPYPCTRNIVIDLFEPNSRQSISKSKSKERSSSKNSLNDTAEKSKLHKSLLKNKNIQEKEEKVQKALERLKSYDIVADYHDQSEV